jgi:hypothetical protein
MNQNLMNKWERPNPQATNIIRRLSDYGFLSFNPKTGYNPDGSAQDDMEVFTDIANNLLKLLDDELLPVRNGGEETALVDNRGDRNQFRILDGDFRYEFAKADTFAQALAVYNEHKAKHRSNWSTTD